MDVRRVVTGHDASGRSVFVSDDTVLPDEPLLLAGSEFHQLWGGDETPHFPDDGAKPAYRTYFPPVGGFGFGMFSIPPGAATPAADLDFEAVLEGAVVLELAGRTTARLALFTSGASHAGVSRHD